MSIIKYKIERIITNHFSLENKDEIGKLSFAISFQFKVNTEERLISCISRYRYLSEEINVMQLELECLFKVEKDNFNSLIKDNKLSINQDFLQYMATIAVGAARGEIHARCQIDNSPLQDIVLPPVNLTKIITKPAEFDLV